METIRLSDNSLEEAAARAAAVLKAGGLVIYPTETLYGAAVDATNPLAVKKLLLFKRRPVGKAVSVLVSSVTMALQYVKPTPEVTNALQTLLPGPVTVVAHDAGVVDQRLISENGTLGIRISSHEFAQAMANAVGVAVTATSANDAGAPRPYSVEIALFHLSDRQKDLVDLVIDAGELPKREPSSVVDFSTDVQVIHRAGANMKSVHLPYLSANEDATRDYGAHVMQRLLHAVNEKPVVILLSGEMGTGKTRFAQGVARALGITRNVSSPSYTLVKEYEAPDGLCMVHADCWRAGSATAAELGLLEALQPGVVTVIEWPQPVLAEYEALARDEAIVLQHYSLASAEGGHKIELL